MITLSYKELKAVAKIRNIKDRKRISEDELLKTREESEKPKPPKTIKGITKENYDSYKMIRDLRALHESNKDFIMNQKILMLISMIIVLNMKAMEIKIKYYLLKSILI